MKNRLISIGVVCFLVIVGFSGFLYLCPVNVQGTNVSGTVYDGSGGPWTLAGSPYIVVGDVTVPAGETLTIDPGVQVRFDGYFGIFVRGNLYAVGDETNRINLTSNSPTPARGDWNCIEISTMGHGDIRHCNISYGNNGIVAYSSSNNFMTNNYIFSNDFYGILLRISSNNNTITDNNVSFNGAGISIRSSSNNSTILNNTVSANDNTGIYLEPSSNNNISNNTVFSNGGTGILICESSNNNVTNNNVFLNQGGITISSSTNNNITNNNVHLNQWAGIGISGSSLNNIIDNDIHSNGEYGLSVTSSHNNIIVGNTESGSREGIYLSSSTHNNLTNNNIYSNDRNGITLYSSSNDNIITENNVSDSLKNFYFYSSSNNIINNNNVTNSYHGVYLHKASNNDVLNNTLLGNFIAIYARDSGSIDARFNYFGTAYQNRIDKLVYSGITGGVDYSNWLGYKESNVEYLKGTVTWTTPITLEKGIIINGTLSISTDVTFNNSFGQNFIQVNGSLHIVDANFASNAGNYTIVYLNDTQGDILNSTFTRQTVVGSHREGNEIRNNTFTNGKVGVALWRARNSNITGNNFSLNSVWGITIESSSNTNIDCNELTINKNGISFYTSTNNTIKNNIILRSEYGIVLQLSSNSIVNDNFISNDEDGILVSSSSNNTISNNVVLNNTGIGIILSFTFNSTVKCNNVSLNKDLGFYVTDSSNNSIYHNNIINNTNQAYDEFSNQWDNGYPSGGNYWSDYNGVDTFKGPDQDIPGSDGIGDTNYSIDSDSIDNYPLMEPIENYNILMQGWNLISTPLIQDNQNLAKVLEMIDGFYDAVQWFDKTDISDPWKHYKSGKPYGNDLFELNETMGFWIHIIQPGDTIFLYNGTRPTSNQTIHLHEGWNMVGYPSLTSYNRTEGLNKLTFGQEVDLIQWYDASIKTWHDMAENDHFEIGRGYWIHANVECVWEVPL